MYTFEEYELARTDDTFKIETRDENKHAVVKMAQQSRKSIEIISRDLDPDLFDTIEFIDAVKTMVLGNRRSSVRILVFDPKKIVTRGHRLLELTRTLTTNTDIRVPSFEHKDFNEMLFITDTTGYVHRLNPERFDATVNFNDKRVSRHLMLKFNDMWSKATQDINLRTLTL